VDILVAFHGLFVPTFHRLLAWWGERKIHGVGYD